MVGWTAGGTSYPFVVNHALRALPLVDWSVTVSYGPTTCWLITCTWVLVAPALSGPPAAAAASVVPPQPPLLPSPTGPPPHATFGAVTTGTVLASSAAIHASRDSSSRA